MRFAQREFDVQFVPGEADAAKMVAAVQGLPRGYKARLARPISASVKGEGVSIAATPDRSSYKAGGKAKIKITLTPDRKVKVKKVSAKVVTGDAVAKGDKKDVKGSKGAVLKITLGKKASHVAVEVTYEVNGKSQTTTVKVPVNVG